MLVGEALELKLGLFYSYKFVFYLRKVLSNTQVSSSFPLRALAINLTASTQLLLIDGTSFPVCDDFLLFVVSSTT